MFVATDQVIKEIRTRINYARSASSRLWFCLWWLREISLRTKGRPSQAVVRLILLYGCETLPVADERMLGVFGIRRILRVSHRDCVTQHAGTVRAKKAPLVCSCCKMSQRWADQGTYSAHTFLRVAQTNWRPTEDVGNHDQGQPLTPLQSANLRTRTMEKGLV